MRELYEKLLEEGEAGILRLINARTPETVTLDFKQKANPKRPGFEKHDKSILGEVLSGFANSMGGLVIWGVDAHKGADDEVDCAQSPAPIAFLEKFLSDAQGLVGQLIMPRHEDIVVAHIPTKSDPSSGYLLVLVGRSERRPHRCEASGHKQYFKRAGDGFFAMEHYDIEDAFNRASVPVIDLNWRIDAFQKVRQGEETKKVAAISLSLINRSLVTAKFPYIRFKLISGLKDGLAEGNRSLYSGLTERPRADGKRSYEGGVNDVIHPDNSFEAVRLLFVLIEQGRGSFTINDTNYCLPDAHIIFDVWWGCENTRLSENRIEIPPETIYTMVSEAFRTFRG